MILGAIEKLLKRRAKYELDFHPRYCLVGTREIALLASETEFVRPDNNAVVDMRSTRDRIDFYNAVLEGSIEISTSYGALRVLLVKDTPTLLEFS